MSKHITRTMLIRQWWYLYLRLLKKDLPTAREEFEAVNSECARRGIVRIARRMPYDGAEDLKHEVELFHKGK